MALFSESATGDVHSPLCFRPVQQTDVFLGDPVVQTRLDNLESRQKGDTFQLRVAWVSLHELDEQDALSGSDGSEAETQRRGRLPLAVACIHHYQTMLFHCRLHCRDVINSIVPSSFPRMRESILPPSFPLLLSHPNDQQYPVILHVHFLMSLRSEFTYILDESMQL